MFASSGFQSSRFSLSLGSHEAWARQSDHVPLICELHEQPPTRPNQSMKPTARHRNAFSLIATTPCRGLSLSR
jgi:hypothetical protein